MKGLTPLWRCHTCASSTSTPTAHPPRPRRSLRCGFTPQLFHRSRERASFIKNEPRSGPTGGHQPSRPAGGKVEPGAAVRECSPRTPLAAHRCAPGEADLPGRRGSFPGTVDLRSYPTRQLEREEQGTPAADLDSPVETRGCWAPSSGAPADSDLPFGHGF